LVRCGQRYFSTGATGEPRFSPESKESTLAKKKRLVGGFEIA
jgi:hypothetical protein